jgi:hypothetical protein
MGTKPTSCLLKEKSKKERNGPAAKPGQGVLPCAGKVFCCLAFWLLCGYDKVTATAAKSGASQARNGTERVRSPRHYSQ